MGLPKNIRHRCVQVFLKCDEFNDVQTLKAVFTVAEELKMYSNTLPEGQTKAERVDKVMAYLVDKYTKDGWVFLIFLKELLVRQPEGDQRKRELEELELKLMTLPGDFSPEFKEYKNATSDLILDKQSSGTRETAVQWLEAADQNFDEWAFRITLVVFNGVAYDAFDEAVRELADRLRPPAPQPKPDAPLPSAFPRRRSQRLKDADAYLEEINVGTEPEPVMAQVVKLHDSDLAYAALKHVWMEYPDWHNHIADWLTRACRITPFG